MQEEGSVQESEGSGKGIKIAIVIFSTFLLIVSGTVSSIFSFFSGERFDATNLMNTQKSQELLILYNKYIDEKLMIEMYEREWTMNWVLNFNCRPNERSTVRTELNNISLIYFMAYYSQLDSFKYGNGSIDEESVYNILDKITRITDREVDEREYRVFNAVATPEEAAELLFTDPMHKEMYLISFDLYANYMGYENVSVKGLWGNYNNEDALASIPNTGMAIPFYYQNDYNMRYGSGTIGTSGCAPTSIAMVFSYLLDRPITPPDIVQFTGNNYYSAGVGSTWAIFRGCANHWNLKDKNIGKNLDKVMEELQRGNPVIASMGKGMFTSSGHIIVIRGCTEDGYFLVNDPNKNNVIKYNTDRFSINQVFRESKNFWSFERER